MNVRIGSVALLIVLSATAACGDDDETGSAATTAATSATTTGPGSSADVTSATLAPIAIDQYSGTYVGTWTNEATGATGSATIVIDTDEAAGTAELSIDFDGNYLGLGDPPAAELSGSVIDGVAVVQGTSDLFGEYDVTIDGAGNIVGVMTNLAGGTVPELTYTGTITTDRLDADYVVTLADGTQVTSVLRMEKQD